MPHNDFFLFCNKCKMTQDMNRYFEKCPNCNHELIKIEGHGVHCEHNGRVNHYVTHYWRRLNER
jgi:uncharacterized protein with PIN domain